MNQNLLNSEVQHFIDNHLNDDPTKIVLKGSPFPHLNIQEIVEQIVSKKKCEKKLPSWFGEKIYYPNKLNIEQTSSEISARYKSELVSGKSIIDITGGFGVDSYFFSQQFDSVTHCEINESLSKIAAYNFKILGIRNLQSIAFNGLEYLVEKDKKYEWIFADPSRRDDHKGKVFLLKDCSPNIVENLDLLFEYTDNIMLKLSPLLDITATVKALQFVKTIHVIALNNEVKEILFILEKGFNEELQIKTVNIKNEQKTYFSAKFNSAVEANFSLPENYLYEPNRAILKAGLFKEISERFNINKLHKNSHLYTSTILINFPGRRFKIVQTSTFDKKKLTQIIPSKKANITVRNFPYTVAQIRKKTGFKEGGEIYLFFTIDIENKHIVLICKSDNSMS